MSKRCRICLCLKPRRDLSELEVTKGFTKYSYNEIMLFCLDIKIDEESKLGTKLCVKCHRKILDFYDFKVMAIKNNKNENNIANNMQKPKALLKVEVEVKHEEVDKASDTEFHDEDPVYNIKNDENNIEENDKSLILHNDVGNIENFSTANIEYVEHSDDELSRENIPKNNDDGILIPIVIEPNTKEMSECNKMANTKQPNNNIPTEKEQTVKRANSKKSGFCKYCGKMVNKLQEHMATHLPSYIWPKQKRGTGSAGTCKICGKTVQRLKKHMVQHLPEFEGITKKSKEQPKEPVKTNKNPVNCLICGREFVSQQYLDIHMKSKHIHHKKKCPVCDKEVVKLKMHMLSAHNRDQLRFQCDWCGMRHSSRYTLENHIAIHTNDRPFHCNDCDKKFIQKSALSEHQRLVHLKIKRYLCQFCSKTYYARSALQTHLTGIHTKDRAFKCLECGKGFNTKGVLKIHMIHVHTQEKNQLCTLCPKRFKTKVELVRHHKEVHLKIKNHQCQFCEASFYNSWKKKRHEYTIHLRHSLDTTDR